MKYNKNIDSTTLKGLCYITTENHFNYNEKHFLTGFQSIVPNQVLVKNTLHLELRSVMCICAGKSSTLLRSLWPKGSGTTFVFGLPHASLCLP